MHDVDPQRCLVCQAQGAPLNERCARYDGANRACYDTPGECDVLNVVYTVLVVAHQVRLVGLSGRAMLYQVHVGGCPFRAWGQGTRLFVPFPVRASGGRHPVPGLAFSACASVEPRRRPSTVEYRSQKPDPAWPNKGILPAFGQVQADG